MVSKNTSVPFGYKKFKTYDWDVEVDIEKQKAKNEYDVVIIGTGIGGLACGALLSKKGYKVLLLEHHFQVGGFYGSFKRKGFIFNNAATEVTGLWDKGPFYLFLKELGLKKEDFFVTNSVKYISDSMAVGWQDIGEFKAYLSNLFPDEKNNLSAFLDDAEAALEERFRDTGIHGVPLPPDLITKVYGEQRLMAHMKECPHYYDWMGKTLKQKLDEHFGQEEIKSLLGIMLNYASLDTDKIPAVLALRDYGFIRHGSFFPKGGAQKLANTIRDFIREHGGKVLLKRRVDKILTEDGKVKGVRAGEDVFKASVVVSNSNAKTTFMDLVDRKDLDPQFVETIEAIKMSESVFMVFLGLDMDLSGFPTQIKSAGLGLVFNSNCDPDLAPMGRSSLTIIDLASYNEFPERGTKEYSRKKKEYADRMIKEAEHIIPRLSENIVVRDAATPKTLERYTFMPEGAIDGPDVSTDTERPYFKTPIKGLYLAGASTYPGGGIELALWSGAICANDICGWKEELKLV
ncbi:MAG: NAD(P)/FAD-dependent oxidoreductase [Deltaproteobacteria bacterium]|nr:NAD(P)/FAD-dependent oxidoreductase [Deltaproteobacteria bacterium]